MKIPFKELKKIIDSSVLDVTHEDMKHVVLKLNEIDGEEYLQITSTNGRVLSRQQVKIASHPSFPNADSCYPKDPRKITLTISGDEAVTLNKWLEGVQKALKNAKDTWYSSRNQEIRVKIGEELNQVQFSNETLLSSVAIPLEDSEKLILSTMDQVPEFYVNAENLRAGIEAVADFPTRGSKRHVVPAIFMDIHLSEKDPLVLKTHRDKPVTDQTHSVIARRNS